MGRLKPKAVCFIFPKMVQDLMTDTRIETENCDSHSWIEASSTNRITNIRN